MTRTLTILGLLTPAAVPLLIAPGAPASAASSLGISGCVGTQLTGISMATANDGWAVGYRYESPAIQTVALHWDGSRWSRVLLPKTGAESYLYAVNALSPTQAVAVGSYRVGGQFRTLVLSWDGHDWTRMPSPSPDRRDNDLYGVSILSANNAWAVGAYGFNRARTLALHWDGSSWQRVTTPNPTSFDFLQSVDGARSDDVWAVGSSDHGTLALHWNGATWKRVASFGRGVLDIMFGVTAISPDDVWGAGNYGASSRPASRALTEQWNGSAWKQVHAPSPGGRNNTLHGVDAVTGNDVWAVGNYRDGKVVYGLANHWDGASWTRFEIPGAHRTLTGVSAVSNDDVWAAGRRKGSVCLLEHWDGTGWTQFVQ